MFPYSCCCARAHHASRRALPLAASAPQTNPELQLMRTHAGGGAHHECTPLKLMKRALDMDFDAAGPRMLSSHACVLHFIIFAAMVPARPELNNRSFFLETYTNRHPEHLVPGPPILWNCLDKMKS